MDDMFSYYLTNLYVIKKVLFLGTNTVHTPVSFFHSVPSL